MSARSFVVAAISLAVACGAEPKAVPAVRVDADTTARRVAPSTSEAQQDDTSHRAAPLASVLPDTARRRTVTPSASDETDLSNFQSAGWRLFDRDSTPRRAVRFFADFTRYTSGVLVVTVDTTLVRGRTEPPFDMATADSIAVGGLGRTERFAMRCRFGERREDERLMGVVPDSTRERWMRPRLAWLVDTAAARIRGMRPDSVSCLLDESPD